MTDFRPDYAVHPGDVLEERLEAMGLSQAEFARRCGRSAKLISEIVSGNAPVEPTTALEFEKVLGVDASVWLGIQSNFELHRSRRAEVDKAADGADWADRFPVPYLVKIGALERPATKADRVSKLLAFFGVASTEAWEQQYGASRVAYRRSRSFASDEFALAAWRRLAEQEATRQACAKYDRHGFEHALTEIRSLTIEAIPDSLHKARSLCNEAGVAVAWVPPLPGVAISGAAWWMAMDKAVIVLSARHKTDDQLWFSFFHEAAHILLHAKRMVYVDSERNDESEIEAEANAWANDHLSPVATWRMFLAGDYRSKQGVLEFANEIGIAPGIVVGRLQHEGRIPWQNLNGLKLKLAWSGSQATSVHR